MRRPVQKQFLLRQISAETGRPKKPKITPLFSTPTSKKKKKTGITAGAFAASPQAPPHACGKPPTAAAAPPPTTANSPAAGQSPAPSPPHPPTGKAPPYPPDPGSYPLLRTHNPDRQQPLPHHHKPFRLLRRQLYACGRRYLHQQYGIPRRGRGFCVERGGRCVFLIFYVGFLYRFLEKPDESGDLHEQVYIPIYLYG